MCSITGAACEYRAYLDILSSLLSLSLSDIYPQRVDCDPHDAFTDETMATRLRVLNRWALQSDDVRLSMWDFLQSVAGGMARFVDGSERCDVHRT